MQKPYCPSIYQTIRRKTREVKIGAIGVGGDNPIRIQSMTTSNTREVDATVEQVIRLADAGCEVVRMTVQGIKEADACEAIRNGLIRRGYTIPLVADIHFFPPAAMRAADFVDKVRINPGNYADKRATFKVIEYDDAAYARELEKIEEKFAPLVEKCKTLNRAIRIGVNHGSLSDRILNRYGDTPFGMVESALEFARVCRKYDFHNFLFSMKSSNPQVMIQAYRLLSREMESLGWDYPLHLGVTEAGDGEDGRIKSAMGIGALLLDGIGDTIRVSLTEDPWHEIDPCKRLAAFADQQQGKGVAPFTETTRDIERFERRKPSLPNHLGMHRDGSVFLSLSSEQLKSGAAPRHLGIEEMENGYKLSANCCDSVICEGELPPSFQNAGIGQIIPRTLKEEASKFAPFKTRPDAIVVESDREQEWEALKALNPYLIILRPEESRTHFCRKFFNWIRRQKLNTPVILNFRYNCLPEDLVIRAAAECGSLFCDGLGDGIWLEGPYDPSLLRSISFGILQSSRMRMIKTDFISCPSCGRTLFDLQEVTQRIRSKTSHLPGVKIGIMGCIVNGPGEMADADFGYVGSRPGKIDLYVGKECVEKNIDFADADERLIELIKAHGRWEEPTAHQPQ